MQDAHESGSGLAVAIIAWIAVFSASWVLISTMTGTTGLALVWGVFIALAAFELSRSSLQRALLIIFLSLFTVLLRGVYVLIA